MMSRAALFSLFLLPGVGLATDSPGLPLPPTYVCQRAEGTIQIDGKGDESDWKNATPLSPLRDIQGPAIPEKTQIRMLWDDEYLYILADMQEEHLRASLTERDSVIFRDPDFEVFIDPDGDGHNYIELEINAFNTVWDLFITQPYRNDSPNILHDWDIPGLRHAVHLRGSINDSMDTDDGWSVEIAIPWQSITSHHTQPRTGTAPEPGSEMRFNFSQVNWPVKPSATIPGGYDKLLTPEGKPQPESNHVWAPTGEINIHMPERWGRVIFSSHKPGTWESPAPAPEEALRQELFRYYNQQLAWRRQHGKFATAEQLTPPAGVRLHSITPHDFYLTAPCSAAGKLLTLSSEGKYTAQVTGDQAPELILWVHGSDHTYDRAYWEEKFKLFAVSGISTVIIGDQPEQIAALTPIARAAGLKVWAWLWALNRPGDTTALHHPDWYAVSADGKSCHKEEERPYVAYYQFLCPNHPGVLNHLYDMADRMAAIPGLEGIQLDYMRMPDVILPRGLWNVYDLVMNEEAPEFDFCYCERCRSEFRSRYGRDVLPDRSADAEWREFRLQSVADVANALSDRIRRKHGLRAASAVFPTPGTAATMVRQDWSRFRSDLVLPMTYYSFYSEDWTWPAHMAQQARREIGGRFSIAPGLHLPDTTPEQLPAELDILLSQGIHSIGLFCHECLNPEFLKALKQWTASKTKKQ